MQQTYEEFATHVGTVVLPARPRKPRIRSQLPPAQWHDEIGEPTLADAICDRLLHNAHRIVLHCATRPLSPSS
jgi:hypothetical protein